MFILDDLLAAPFKGVMWILKEIVAAAEEEQAAESDRIKDRLRELYMLLETGQMTEAEFDAEESALLDRLDELEQAGAADADDQGEEGEEEDDDAEEEDDDREDGARYAAAPERTAEPAGATDSAGEPEQSQPVSSDPGPGEPDDGG